MRETLQKYEHERQRSIYENVLLKQKIERQDKELRKLRRDLSDKVDMPDPKDADKANIMLSESQMKRDDMMSMQKSFDFLSKKV